MPAKRGHDEFNSDLNLSSPGRPTCLREVVAASLRRRQEAEPGYPWLLPSKADLQRRNDPPRESSAPLQSQPVAVAPQEIGEPVGQESTPGHQLREVEGGAGVD